MLKRIMDKGKVVDIRGRLGATTVLDEVATVFNQGRAYLIDATALLGQGIHSYGKEVMTRELCRRLSELTDEEDSTYIAWALCEINDELVVQHLQQLLYRQELSPRVRTEAAMVLHTLGVTVDAQELPLQSFQDIQEILNEIELQVQQVNESERAFVLNELFDGISRFMGHKNAVPMLRVLVATILDYSTPIAADMLWTLSQFGPEAIRPLAMRSLGRLNDKGFVPSLGMIAGVYDGVFTEAWMTLPETEAPRGQLFGAWRYADGRLMAVSFLIDFRFGGGAAKDFFICSALTDTEFADTIAHSKELGIPLECIDEERFKSQIECILQANIKYCRPLPETYRRFHRMVDKLVFTAGPAPLIPSLDAERDSPLPRQAAQVEDVVQEYMQEGKYVHAQILNARMLWRDFYECCTPKVGKIEVWAAAIEYTIGQLECYYEQTQQVIAERYAISASSVSRRSGEIKDRFLNVEDNASMYVTDKNLPNFSGVLENLLGEEFLLEDTEADYEAYLEEHTLAGRELQRLSLEEFVRLSAELNRLEEWADLEGLDAQKQQRFEDLTQLLLLD